MSSNPVRDLEANSVIYGIMNLLLAPKVMLRCPSIPPEARVALTLPEVCGLTTEEIAKSVLITPRSSYEKALALTQQEPERQFLQERLR